MNKKMLLSIFAGVALVASTVSASPLENIDFGLRVAGNNAGVSTASTKSKMGFAIGGTATYAYTDAVSFGTELQYSMKGYKGNTNKDDKLQRSFNYINIPVYATYTLPTEASGFKFNATAGGYVSYLLSASGKNTSGDKIEKVKDDIYDGDYGLIAGVGAVYNDMVSVDLRYELGLKEYATKMKNKNITLGVSYLFN